MRHMLAAPALHGDIDFLHSLLDNYANDCARRFRR
jgi:hypothetical protein